MGARTYESYERKAVEAGLKTSGAHWDIGRLKPDMKGLEKQGFVERNSYLSTVVA